MMRLAMHVILVEQFEHSLRNNYRFWLKAKIGRSIAMAIKLFDHFGEDADRDGIGRDVAGNKTQGS